MSDFNRHVLNSFVYFVFFLLSIGLLGKPLREVILDTVTEFEQLLPFILGRVSNVVCFVKGLLIVLNQNLKTVLLVKVGKDIVHYLSISFLIESDCSLLLLDLSELENLLVEVTDNQIAFNFGDFRAKVIKIVIVERIENSGLVGVDRLCSHGRVAGLLLA